MARLSRESLTIHSLQKLQQKIGIGFRHILGCIEKIRCHCPLVLLFAYGHYPRETQGSKAGFLRAFGAQTYPSFFGGETAAESKAEVINAVTGLGEV
jgi:hypothetical protein